MAACTCCYKPAPCCPGLTLPNTLHASFENTATPPAPCNTCISGSIALTYGADPSNPTTWYGTGAFGTCGENIKVWFCINTLTPACQCFIASLQMSNACTGGGPPADCTLPGNLSCGCSPFFLLLTADAGTCCNGVNNAGYNFRVHITT